MRPCIKKKDSSPHEKKMLNQCHSSELKKGKVKMITLYNKALVDKAKQDVIQNNISAS